MWLEIVMHAVMLLCAVYCANISSVHGVLAWEPVTCSSPAQTTAEGVPEQVLEPLTAPQVRGTELMVQFVIHHPSCYTGAASKYFQD